MGTVVFTNNIASFISVKMFPILLDTLDLHGSLLIYAVFSIVGAFFVLFVMEETSGQSLDDVDVVANDTTMERDHKTEITNC